MATVGDWPATLTIALSAEPVGKHRGTVRMVVCGVAGAVVTRSRLAPGGRLIHKSSGASGSCCAMVVACGRSSSPARLRSVFMLRSVGTSSTVAGGIQRVCSRNCLIGELMSDAL